jgi:hypothetical protein
MNIEKIFEFIQKETPSHAEEMWSAIDLLSNTLENTQSAINGTLPKLAIKREYDKANEYISISKEMAEIIDIINEYIKKYALNIEELNEVVIEDDETDEDTENSDNEVQSSEDKINYEKYRVNEEVAYNLYTDFTHKKPAAFSLDGEKYPARQWKLIFTRTCELLFQKNKYIFNAFALDKDMQGKKRSYFSTMPENILKPKKIVGTDIYVETNLSANNIRNIIIDMLDKYRIPKSTYQIYLSKDLTPLHRDDNSKESRIETDSDEDYHSQS